MTDRLRAAANDALNALLRVQPQVRGAIPVQDVEEAIMALRAALAEPKERQSTHSAECYKWHHECAIARIEREQVAEPVAWMVYTLDGQSVCVTDNPADFTTEHRVLPLYTTPPRREWQGLTDEERKDIREHQELLEELGPVWSPMLLYYYLAIEAALKEKNGA